MNRDCGGPVDATDEKEMPIAVSHPTVEECLRNAGCAFESDVPLGPRTWYGVGGSAQTLAHPADADQLTRLVQTCRESDIPFRVLGKGANLLVCEGIIPGVTIRLDRMRNFTIDESSVTAQGGADLEKVITATVRNGLEGLETLAGIPATIGGALRMNAGGSFGTIGPLVESVTCIEPDGRRTTLLRDELAFNYRTSNLTRRIVTEAQLQIKPVADRALLRARLKEVMRYKKQSQPMAACSAGCAFKNPPQDVTEKGAGQLIDETGAKGLRYGGAQVSDRHANFIILHEGGRASDVLALMQRVERAVKDYHDITLQREIVVWSAEGRSDV